jgi:hypothetical protein
VLLDNTQAVKLKAASVAYTAPPEPAVDSTFGLPAVSTTALLGTDAITVPSAEFGVT